MNIVNKTKKRIERIILNSSNKGIEPKFTSLGKQRDTRVYELPIAWQSVQKTRLRKYAIPYWKPL